MSKKSLKFLYVTDLHGNEEKYLNILGIAKDKGVSLIINGGDLFPYRDQENFITGFLEDYFTSLFEAGIQYVCQLGNDDLQIHDELFNNLCSSYSNVHNIAQRKVEVAGYEFVGMNYVLDYPFRLKDRCRKDDKDFVQERQFGTALFSTGNSNKDIIEIQNWTKDLGKEIEGYRELSRKEYKKYLDSVPTIAEELRKLPKPANKDKCIYIIHQPPSRLGLDVCMDGRKVGSDALLQFLCDNPCFCSLHGHIHESPYMSREWGALLTNGAVAVQPGQYNELSYVIVEPEKKKFTKYPTKVKNYYY